MDGEDWRLAAFVAVTAGRLANRWAGGPGWLDGLLFVVQVAAFLVLVRYWTRGWRRRQLERQGEGDEADAG